MKVCLYTHFFFIFFVCTRACWKNKTFCCFRIKRRHQQDYSGPFHIGPRNQRVQFPRWSERRRRKQTPVPPSANLPDWIGSFGLHENEIKERNPRTHVCCPRQEAQYYRWVGQGSFYVLQLLGAASVTLSLVTGAWEGSRRSIAS